MAKKHNEVEETCREIRNDVIRKVHCMKPADLILVQSTVDILMAREELISGRD